MRRHLFTIPAALATTALLLTGCSSEPSTKAEVCTSYKDLSEQYLQGNTIGNPLFDRIDDLSDVTGRYEGSEVDLSANSERLGELADADGVSGDELTEATSEVATLCGAPLGLASMMGN